MNNGRPGSGRPLFVLGCGPANRPQPEPGVADEPPDVVRARPEQRDDSLRGDEGVRQRARAELRATGETLRREAVVGDELTPQDQIAIQVAGDWTNREVAAALSLSPKTIEFHLGRIYQKLGIRSRRDLARVFAAQVEVC